MRIALVYPVLRDEHEAGMAPGDYAEAVRQARAVRALSRSAGVLFTLVNIPFFLFAHKVMGARFAVKTVLVNIGIGAASAITRVSVHVDTVHPAFAALVGGTVIGMGILALARHQAGVGGTGVITIWLYRKRGWNMGMTQVALDVFILSLAIPVVTGPQLAWSAVSAAAISLILFAWHRPGLYMGR